MEISLHLQCFTHYRDTTLTSQRSVMVILTSEGFRLQRSVMVILTSEGFRLQHSVMVILTSEGFRLQHSVMVIPTSEGFRLHRSMMVILTGEGFRTATHVLCRGDVLTDAAIATGVTVTEAAVAAVSDVDTLNGITHQVNVCRPHHQLWQRNRPIRELWHMQLISNMSWSVYCGI